MYPDYDKDCNEELVSLVTRLYKEKNLEIQPMFPKVLVRLLPREQQTKSGLWLPDGAQNKPVHEGVVLRVYKPFWRSIWKTAEWYTVIANSTLLDEKDRIQAVWQECAAPVGSHVIFPHMALGITPVWPLDGGSGGYRLVPEGEILGTVDYERQPVKEWLKKVLDDDLDSESTAKTILEEACVVRHSDMVSKTLSGR